MAVKMSAHLDQELLQRRERLLKIFETLQRTYGKEFLEANVWINFKARQRLATADYEEIDTSINGMLNGAEKALQTICITKNCLTTEMGNIASDFKRWERTTFDYDGKLLREHFGNDFVSEYLNRNEVEFKQARTLLLLTFDRIKRLLERIENILVDQIRYIKAIKAGGTPKEMLINFQRSSYGFSEERKYYQLIARAIHDSVYHPAFGNVAVAAKFFMSNAVNYIEKVRHELKDAPLAEKIRLAVASVLTLFSVVLLLKEVLNLFTKGIAAFLPSLLGKSEAKLTKELILCVGRICA